MYMDLGGTPEGPLGNGDPLEGGFDHKKRDPRRSYKGGLHYIGYFTVHFPKAILYWAEPIKEVKRYQSQQKSTKEVVEPIKEVAEPTEEVD